MLEKAFRYTKTVRKRSFYEFSRQIKCFLEFFQGHTELLRVAGSSNITDNVTGYYAFQHHIDSYFRLSELTVLHLRRRKEVYQIEISKNNNFLLVTLS